MERICERHYTFNPFRTAVPFWGQTSQISSSFVPKRDRGSKINAPGGRVPSKLQAQLHQYFAGLLVAYQSPCTSYQYDTRHVLSWYCCRKFAPVRIRMRIRNIAPVNQHHPRGKKSQIAITRYQAPQVSNCFMNPFSTAVPLWGQTSLISSELYPKRDWGPKRVNSLRTRTWILAQFPCSQRSSPAVLQVSMYQVPGT